MRPESSRPDSMTDRGFTTDLDRAPTATLHPMNAQTYDSEIRMWIRTLIDFFEFDDKKQPVESRWDQR